MNETKPKIDRLDSRDTYVCGEQLKVRTWLMALTVRWGFGLEVWSTYLPFSYLLFIFVMLDLH